MLSSVLRSDTAIEVNIRIMRACERSRSHAENSLPSKEKLSSHVDASLWHITLLVACDMGKHTLQSVKIVIIKHLHGIVLD